MMKKLKNCPKQPRVVLHKSENQVSEPLKPGTRVYSEGSKKSVIMKFLHCQIPFWKYSGKFMFYIFLILTETLQIFFKKCNYIALYEKIAFKRDFGTRERTRKCIKLKVQVGLLSFLYITILSDLVYQVPAITWKPL